MGDVVGNNMKYLSFVVIICVNLVYVRTIEILLKYFYGSDGRFIPFTFSISVFVYLIFLQDTFDIRICMAPSQKYTIDFSTAEESELYTVDIEKDFVIRQTSTIHGLAFWFDVAFIGSEYVFCSVSVFFTLLSTCSETI